MDTPVMVSARHMVGGGEAKGTKHRAGGINIETAGGRWWRHMTPGSQKRTLTLRKAMGMAWASTSTERGTGTITVARAGAD